MFGRITSLFFKVSLLVVLCSAFSAAQDLDDVTISGRITDSNGLAVVGATITAMRVETGDVQTMVTDDDGRYRFLKLKPGTYKVKAAASGFGAKETPEIVTISAQNVQRDFTLAPADVRSIVAGTMRPSRDSREGRKVGEGRASTREARSDRGSHKRISPNPAHS